MPLAPGAALSHYRLVAPIGEGGMGVVWRASDSTLGRDVAIKVLPDLFVADPERLARFEREARLLASLNHPHIASIYGLHSADGVRFLVMELVEGEDLAQRLHRGAIPLAEALPIALQIAQALEHAHERGIIHRDLKPANVKLTSEGRAKVLDFGLAKALEDERTASPGSSMLSQSPTITGHMTGTNVLLGTAAYMAPEQARGHAADRRADVWAFGVVVMEMLIGRRLFEGETISDTLASVLKTDPDWTLLPRETPQWLRTLLRRCLDRNARQRLRDIGEARIVLEELVAGKDPEPAAAVAPSRARRAARTAAIGAAGLVLGILGTFAAVRGLPSRVETPLRKFQLPLPPGGTATPQSPVISPDGSTVAYVRNGEIWLQSLSDMAPRLLKGDAQATHLFWSPDARFLGYTTGMRIMKISLDGGENQAVCEVRGDLGSGSGASWLEDGWIAFSRADSDGVFRVPAVGGDPTTWIRPDSAESDLHEPFVLPGGRGVLYVGHRFEHGTNNVSLWSRGRRKTLLEFGDQRVANPVYDPAGYVLFSRTAPTAGVWALPFSLSRLEATGSPFLVVPGGSFPSVSREGTLSCVTSTPAGLRQLMWVARDGKETGTIGEPELGSGVQALTTDAKRVAWSLGPTSNRDIWIFDVARGTRSRVTFDPGSDEGPAWTPSGDRLLYRVLIPGAQPPTGFRVVSRASDGTGAVDTLVAGGSPGVTPDGRTLLYQTFERGGSIWSLSAKPLDGSGESRLVLRGNPRLTDSRVSPSGRFVAYASNESERWEVYLARFPSGEGRWPVSVAGGQSPRWNARGDRLYFVQGDDIMEVDVGGGDTPELGTPKRLFTRPSGGTAAGFGLTPTFEVTGDGQRFLVTRTAGDQGPAPGIAVIQNWAAEFRNRK